MMVQKPLKKLFKESPDTSLFICGAVYPPVHSSYEGLESMKIFVGIQTNCCTNTSLLWCRTLSAGRNRPAAKLIATCAIGKGAEDIALHNRQFHNSERWTFLQMSRSQRPPRSAKKHGSFSFHTPTKWSSVDIIKVSAL